MAGQRYDSVAGRLENFRGRVLARVNYDAALAKYGDMHDIPMNESRNIEFLRMLPYGNVDNQFIASSATADSDFVNAHRIADGVTPSAESVSRVTRTATLEELGCLYSYTNQFYELHEETKPFMAEMEQQVSDRLALAVDMQNWGEMKGTANDFYGGAGTSPTTVNGAMTRILAQTIEKTIRRLHGLPVNRLEKSGMEYGSQAVPASFVALTHTDMRMSLELDPDFKKVEDYGHVARLDEDREFGMLGSIRFLEDPTLTYLPNYGAAVGTWTGPGTPASDLGVNINVYPIIVLGKGRGAANPFGQVRLKSKSAIELSNVPLKQKDSGDPLGQRGYIGGCLYHTQLIQNDAHMAAAFVGARVA